MNYAKICDCIDRRMAPEHGSDRLECWELDRMNRIREKAVNLWNRKITLKKLRFALKKAEDPAFRARIIAAITNYDNWSEGKKFDEPQAIFRLAEKEYGVNWRDYK